MSKDLAKRGIARAYVMTNLRMAQHLKRRDFHKVSEGITQRLVRIAKKINPKPRK